MVGGSEGGKWGLPLPFILPRAWRALWARTNWPWGPYEPPLSTLGWLNLSPRDMRATRWSWSWAGLKYRLHKPFLGETESLGMFSVGCRWAGLPLEGLDHPCFFSCSGCIALI